jgi:acyl-CoA reductase-like NAD-dependent aldehyde dehydrogenase
MAITASSTGFRARNPSTGEPFGAEFVEATEAMVDRALVAAEGAFEPYRAAAPSARAAFLRRIGDEIVALGDELLELASAETALPPGRLTGERGRTVGQLRMFAERVEEGSWVEARIDPAQPERAPAARPDIRRMLIPLGPVGVFGASNFPLAFSVAGGDTASALAAGCPVVFKAHPAHPGTSALVGDAIARAAAASGMPEGVFSLLQGAGHEVGLWLTRHPLTRAIGFTGSLRGGRALFDAAAARPEPIPVYAEMGSVNPVFLLPSAVAARAEALGEGLAGSITMGVGQFCTNPGVLVGLRDPALDRLTATLSERVAAAPAAAMLYPAIGEGYRAAVAGVRADGAVEVLAEAAAGGGGGAGSAHRLHDVRSLLPRAFPSSGRNFRTGESPRHRGNASGAGGGRARAGGTAHRERSRDGRRPSPACRTRPHPGAEGRADHLQRLSDGRGGGPRDAARRALSRDHRLAQHLGGLGGHHPLRAPRRLSGLSGRGAPPRAPRRESARDLASGRWCAHPTRLISVPIGSIVMRISSPAARVKESGGTTPVPVRRMHPPGKVVSR